jgi:hypothetical protein
MRVIAWAVLALVMMLPAPSFSQEAQLPATTQVGLPRGADEAPPPTPRPKPAFRATPRWPDGRPMMGAPSDEKGLWGSCCGRLATEKTPYKPWARAVAADRRLNQLEPHTRCKASGGPRQFITPYGTEIVDLPYLEQILVFDIGGPYTFRTIYLDGRPHPKDLQPSYYGHSIGHFEGDTLVVDTVGFNERFWMDRGATPHTEKLRLVERFTRTDFHTMKYQITVDDPGAYTAVWTTEPYELTWSEGRELFEYVCQQSNYAHELMVGAMEKVDRSTLIVP